MIHNLVEGKKVKGLKYARAKRWIVGTPTWYKAGLVSYGGRGMAGAKSWTEILSSK